jgi:hypothetical protein
LDIASKIFCNFENTVVLAEFQLVHILVRVSPMIFGTSAGAQASPVLPLSAKEMLMPSRFAWVGLVVVALSAWFGSAAQVAGNLRTDTLDLQGQGGVAKCVKIEGALLERTKDGFKALKTGDSIPPQTLVVGLPEAELVAGSGKVGVKLLLYMGDALPVTEAAVTFHDSKQYQADLSIDRGIVAITNLAGKGDTEVRIRGVKQTWDLTLKDPDTSLLVARFGRHQPGTKLLQGGMVKPLTDEPMAHLGVLVTKGRVVVNTGSSTYALNAPPGPALISWDTAAGYEVKQLQTLPDEVRKLDVTELKNYKEACDILAKLAAGDLGKGLDELIASDSPLKRRVAVASMAAIDDINRLLGALDNVSTVTPETRQ